MDDILELQNVMKKYKKKYALSDFSFKFKHGIYALIGPNGAGKSTLMNIISGNIIPDEGKVLWNEKEIAKIPIDFRSILGYMPQQQNLYNNMSLKIFLEYIAALKCIDKKKATEQISNLSEKVELYDCLDKKIGTFSGGMKQRALLIATLLGNPSLIILDEPTAGLDPKQRVIMKNIIKELSEKKIIIISTHIISDIESIAKDILLIKDGKLIEHGSANELMERCQMPEKNLEKLYLQYYGAIEDEYTIHRNQKAKKQ